MQLFNTEMMFMHPPRTRPIYGSRSKRVLRYGRGLPVRADFAALPYPPEGLAHLLMVDNPAHNPDGDFVLDGAGRLHAEGADKLTFAGIGVYRPALLDGWREVIGAAPGAEADPPRFKLAPLLRAAMQAGRVSGAHHRGRWTDVGTPQRLAELEQSLA